MDSKYIDVSVVIPTYRGENSLQELTQQIAATFATTNKSFEIIFVCDNSPDRSWEVIRRITQENFFVKGILLRTNVGQHNALMAGLTQSTGRIIITMDDDLQHSPADILELCEELNKGFDLVYAKFKKRHHATWKVLGSRFNDKIACILLKKPKGLYLSPFRAFRREIRNEILRYRGPFVYLDGLILSVTKQISTIEVTHHGRHAGESGYSLKKSISLWLKMATNFSVVPLRITSLAGMACAALGFAFGLFIIVQKITLAADRFPLGWSSIIVAILFVGGLQLIAIGVVGEYLGRVLITINALPQFTIKEHLNLTMPNADQLDN